MGQIHHEEAFLCVETLSIVGVSEDGRRIYESVSVHYKWLSKNVVADLGTEGRTFDLRLKATPDQPLSFTADGLDHFAEYEVYLVDPARSRFYDLRTEPSTLITPSAETSELILIVGSASLVEQMREELVPDQTALMGNYPNPFQNQTKIEYTLSDDADVVLEVFNVLGQRVRRLVDSRQQPGWYTLTWDGRDEGGTPVSSGLYVYQLRAGNWKQSRTMMQIR